MLEARARSTAGDAVPRADRARREGGDGARRTGGERPVPIDAASAGDAGGRAARGEDPGRRGGQGGASWIDLSLLTGESVPVDVAPGDEVVGASINGHGRLAGVRDDGRAGTRSSRSIVRLLEAAAGLEGAGAAARRSDLRRVRADRAGIAAATFVGWLAVGGVRAGQALLHAAAVLVDRVPVRARARDAGRRSWRAPGAPRSSASCSRAGRCSRRARGADTVLLDKTGTVTEGVMTVTALVPADGAEADVLLALPPRSRPDRNTRSRARSGGAAERGWRCRGADPGRGGYGSTARSATPP